MNRVIRLEDWMAQELARRALAEKIGWIRRRPLDQQISKSRAKRALLKAMYGPYGQPGRPTAED
jgi:hypothetical protein